MPRRILITGASVAGATTAWWLADRGFEVEVVEKASGFRDGGQNVDVRGVGREVLRRMDLEAKALALTTGERGTDWVDEQDRPVARFEVAQMGDGPSAEMEILRGDIARLIYDAANGRAAFRFGDVIAGIDQDADGVDVTFESGLHGRYDLVIVAEGVGSPTRKAIFPGEARSRWMDITLAYFSIPALPEDRPFARTYQTRGGRGATLKPGRDGKLHVYLGFQKKPGGEQDWGAERQKAWLRRGFDADEWLFRRLLDGMDATEDFYFEVLRQVKIDRWSNGRVILTGDAAWCPTPLSGIGTTLAIVGGYVLAGELGRGDNHVAALARYEQVMRPFVDEGQGVPKIVPRLLWPHTRAGIAMLRIVMHLAATPAVRKTFVAALVRSSRNMALPDYSAPHAVSSDNAGSVTAGSRSRVGTVAAVGVAAWVVAGLLRAWRRRTTRG